MKIHLQLNQYSQTRCRFGIEVEGRVRMIAEKTRADQIGNGFLQSLAHDLGFLGTEGHQRDFFCRQNRAAAHGDGARWHVLDATKSRRGILSGDFIEMYLARDAVCG